MIGNYSRLRVSGASGVVNMAFFNNPEPTAGKPGGWNPPGKQSNHTYTAIYFRKDKVAPVRGPFCAPHTTA